MRTLRLCLAGMVILVLLVGASGVVGAQTEEGTSTPPLVEVSGRMECYDLFMGTLEDVVVAATDEGDIVRREWRDPYLSISVREISDPRLAGRITNWFSSDEYLFASDEQPWQLSPDVPDVWPPGVSTGVIRLINADGYWQGSTVVNAYVDGDNSTATVVLTGDGAYEGLTAVLELEFDESNPVCAWDAHGYIIEGELPPMPEPPAE